MSGRHPPPQTATAADGTHPTGMHSCSLTNLELGGRLSVSISMEDFDFSTLCDYGLLRYTVRSIR